MKIGRRHRQPLPGSDDVLLSGNVTDFYVLQIEADALLQAIVSRLPEQLAHEVERLAASQSDAEFKARYECAIDQALLHGQGIAFDAADGLRSKCPLCNGTPQSAYVTADGFLLPHGLEKHLTGHQRAYECAVLAAARRRASAGAASGL